MSRRMMMLMQKSVARTYATWNPADKGTNTILTNGDLTATVAGSVRSGARSTQSKSSEKWYWEATNTAGGSEMSFGAATISADLNGLMGSDTNAILYLRTGIIFYNNTTLATVSSHTSGSILGFAYDATANTLAFYLNNVLQYTATGLPSTLFAACDSRLGTGMTANFGATPFTYTPPAGYNAGLYT